MFRNIIINVHYISRFICICLSHCLAGKTDTIAALVQYLVMLKQTVIITSHTHSAVDNVLLKLRGKVNFLRLASPFKVHPDIKVYCEEIVLENCVINSVEDVEAAYNVVI